MKFLVLLADSNPGDWDQATEAERETEMQAHHDFAAAVSARAEMLGGEALTGIEAAVTLQPGATGPDRVLTDGPYAESAEQLGGYYLIKADDRDTVVDLCRMLPIGYTIEIREVIEMGDDDQE